MAVDDDVQDVPITQVGSALHQLLEIRLRLDYLDENPNLIEQRPDVYIQYRNEFKALFMQDCDRESWFWYCRNSNGRE